MMVAAAFAMVGCGDSAEPPAAPGGVGPAEKAIRIGAVLPTFGHPFFAAQKRGLEEAARELGVALEVRDGRDDDRTQLEQVEALLNRGVKALVLCPRNQDAAVRAVEIANDEKVPVVALNRRVNGGEVVAYVGADDVEAGRAQARALLTALGSEGGRILYLLGTQGSSPQVQRMAGFREVIDAHPEVSIADTRFADFRADQAKAVVTAWVQRFSPGEVRAIVAQNDEMALPAAELAGAEGWGDVIVIGCDGTAAAFEAIRSGALTATVLQDAADQGARALKAAVETARGTFPAGDILTPLPVITKANVDEHRPSY
jgi:ABC-type sugar transport system substrate-binding protein